LTIIADEDVSLIESECSIAIDQLYTNGTYPFDIAMTEIARMEIDNRICDISPLFEDRTF